MRTTFPFARWGIRGVVIDYFLWPLKEGLEE